MIICPGLFLGGSWSGGSCQCICSFSKPGYWQERSVHAGTRNLVKMVRICKIIAEKNTLKLKRVVKVMVMACSGSPKVVHLKILLFWKLTNHSWFEFWCKKLMLMLAQLECCKVDFFSWWKLHSNLTLAVWASPGCYIRLTQFSKVWLRIVELGDVIYITRTQSKVHCCLERLRYGLGYFA